MGHRGYSGNHPRYSRSGDERYDAKEAYNKDLTASARLHYLENDRHDHESPNHMSVNQRLDDSFGLGQNTDKKPSPMNNIGVANNLGMRKSLRTINDMANYAYDDQGYRDDPSYTHGMQFGYEDYRAPGGYEYENVQAMARHADMRNAFGLDADQQREEVDMMRMDDIAVEPTGYNNSMFAESPMPRRSKSKRLRDRAINISERSGAERGDEYDYENPRVQKLLNKANKLDERSGEMKGNMTRHIRPLPKKKVDDERSGEIRNEMLDEMIDNRPDSPMNEISKRGQRILNQADKARDAYSQGDVKKGDRHTRRAKRIKKRDDKGHARANQSPMNACPKSEGGSGCVKQMGGSWRVISNKTDKPWPAKYASKAKADAALRGYHAG